MVWVSCLQEVAAESVVPLCAHRLADGGHVGQLACQVSGLARQITRAAASATGTAGSRARNCEEAEDMSAQAEKHRSSPRTLSSALAALCSLSFPHCRWNLIGPSPPGTPQRQRRLLLRVHGFKAEQQQRQQGRGQARGKRLQGRSGRTTGVLSSRQQAPNRAAQQRMPLSVHRHPPHTHGPDTPTPSWRRYRG